MYLAISAVAAMCAILAAVQTRNAKRLGADLRKKTFEAESFQLASQANEQRLGAEKLVHAQLADRITKVETALRESEDTACRLRQELQTERETAKHWKEEFLKEQAYRLSAEGRIMREVNNLLRYDGTAHGQEELSDE